MIKLRIQGIKNVRAFKNNKYCSSRHWIFIIYNQLVMKIFFRLKYRKIYVKEIGNNIFLKNIEAYVQNASRMMNDVFLLNNIFA